MHDRKQKYALVLGGGGFKGAFQLGAIRYLRENWKDITGSNDPMQFDIVAGVSVGSLNGVMIASNQYHFLERLWNDVAEHGGGEIYHSNFIDGRGNFKADYEKIKNNLLPSFRFKTRWLGKLLYNRKNFFETVRTALGNDLSKTIPEFKSLADNVPLFEKIKIYAKRDKIPDHIQFVCGFVSLQNGKYYSCLHKDFDSDIDFAKAIAASSAMPLIWSPVKEINYNGEKIFDAVDGGVRNNSPLNDAINLINADKDSDYHIFVINCSSGGVEVQHNNWNIANIAFRSLADIAMEEIFNNDLKSFFDINEYVKQAEEKNLTLYHTTSEGKKQPLRYFNNTLIAPDQNVIGTTLDSKKEKIQERIVHGFEKAKEACRNIFS